MCTFSCVYVAEEASRVEVVEEVSRVEVDIDIHPTDSGLIAPSP